MGTSSRSQPIPSTSSSSSNSGSIPGPAENVVKSTTTFPSGGHSKKPSKSSGPSTSTEFPANLTPVINLTPTVATTSIHISGPPSTSQLFTAPPNNLQNSPKKPNLKAANWQWKITEMFSKFFGGKGKKGNGGQEDRRASEASDRERVLKANDREFNAQFKYADNYIQTSKYNVISFVPKNLFEQFQRLANFYFLLLMILQFIPQISSVSWWTTAIPLFIVLAFSACKDGYDDLQRHISDSQVNNRVSYIVRNGRLEEEKWMNVKVGDVIRMENDHFVAADLLLVSTSEPHGLCYIETAELDGETNLKTRSALPETAVMGDVVKDISKFDGEVICEAPNNRIPRFEGKLTFRGQSFPLDNEKILLRGCRLRNTRWCYGVVLFAGRDTKLMMNSGKTKFKRTSLDRFLNILIMGIVLFLIAMCLICTVLCGIWELVTGQHFTEYLEWDRSIVPSGDNSNAQIAIISFLMFFSYIILLNTVVPISLYVSVEVLRFIHSMWINFDTEMYYAKNDVSSRARTTTLNEELGQVQYVFSDKTGTLTQNIMTFNKCTINGISYGDLMTERGEILEITDNTPALDFSFNNWYETIFKFFDKRLLEDTRKGVPEVQEFWRLLAICHTVMPERKTGSQLEYQAQSPDEAALTSAARNFGFVFKSRTPQSITIEVNGREEMYEMLQIIDFDNVRKRMSLLVRTRNGKIILYCKGADTMILERIHPNTSPLLKDATMQHLDKFASDGLRTLCVAYKEIDPDFCMDWLNRYKEASMLQGKSKEETLEILNEEIEKDMVLLGATAIEDKLQDGVPATIANLTAANIKVWVLTGDKTETAINIGYSCKLLTEDMKEVFVIDGKDDHEVEVQLKDTRRRMDREKTNAPPISTTTQLPSYNYNIMSIHDDRPNSPRDDIGLVQPAPYMASGGPQQTIIEEESPQGTEGYALVINGDSLAHALKPAYEKMFLEIGCQCSAVICCRVTPLQKAQVVALVKRNKKAVTLSIGDGANDVSMIKEAHIGVGISGQEGMQAVLASDYSIGQFKYLERLLLVHGRWSYYRMCKFLRYFFYKNFSFTLTHFWFSFFSAYSAQTVYDPILISCYNLFFTSLPVLVMGVMDQDVNDEYSLKYPKLYIPGQYNLFFNMRIFIYSVIHGMASSLVLFFIPYGTLYQSTDHLGKDMNDFVFLEFTVFTALIVVVNGQIMFDTAYWTAINHFVIWGSIIFYVALVVVFYEALPVGFIASTGSLPSYGVVFRAFRSPHFWFAIFLVAVILLLPVLVNRFFWFDTHPSYADRLRVRCKLPKEKREPSMVPMKHLPPRTAATRKSRRGSLRSGYAFSHSQGFGELIAKGKLFKNIEHLKLPNSQRSSSRPTSPTRGSSRGLSPIIEHPPGFIAGAATTIPQTFASSSNESTRPNTKDSRPTSVQGTQFHSFIVNQGDDPLPTNWTSSDTPTIEQPPKPGTSARDRDIPPRTNPKVPPPKITMINNTPRAVTHFPPSTNFPNMPSSSNFPNMPPSLTERGRIPMTGTSIERSPLNDDPIPPSPRPMTRPATMFYGKNSRRDPQDKLETEDDDDEIERIVERF
uniref:Phospholipid-transporting ATPase n=2 Tax=Acrobeloides nanus TaxID=290746 RepID=A0A914E2E4_9BILA